MKINIDNIDVNYIVEGVDSNYTILLLHGWGVEIETYRVLIDELKKNFKVYAIDFPGFGKTPNPPETYTVLDYAKLTLEFINRLGLENVVLIGHSFGGRVIVKMVSKLGYSPKKIILIDSAGVKPKRKFGYHVKTLIYKVVKTASRLVLGKKKSQEFITKYRNKRGSADYLAADETMKNVFKNVVNEDLVPHFKDVTMPTLLIWGELDMDTPLSDAKIMEKEMKDAGLVVIKGAGHFSFLNNLNQVVIVINKFLER